MDVRGAGHGFIPFVMESFGAMGPRAKEMFQQLSEYQPIGRMGKPSEMASLVCAQIRPCSFVQLTPSFRSSRTGPLPVL